MRLLALAPFLALAAAQVGAGPSLMALCGGNRARDTLWIADGRAYTCAPMSRGDVVAFPGDYCISAPMAELEGGADLCSSSSDCPLGVCVAMESGGFRKVCWKLTWDGKCSGDGA